MSSSNQRSHLAESVKNVRMVSLSKQTPKQLDILISCIYKFDKICQREKKVRI